MKLEAPSSTLSFHCLRAQFFPKTEKYVSLFTGDDEQVVARRTELREKIKANRVAAAAAGVDLEGSWLAHCC